LYITEVDYSASLVESNPSAAILHAREGLALARSSPLLISPDGGLAQLADGLRRLGRYPEAVESLRAAIAARQQLLRQDPEHFTVRQQLLRAAISMEGLLLASSDTTGALEQGRQAVALAEELSAAIPTNPLAQRDRADAYEALGRSIEHRDRAEARRWYQKSLDLWTAWPKGAHSGRMDQRRRLQAQALVARCQ